MAAITTAGLVWASGASTTISYIHKGVALPAARVIVIAVPLIVLSGLWWLVNRRGR